MLASAWTVLCRYTCKFFKYTLTHFAPSYQNYMVLLQSPYLCCCWKAESRLLRLETPRLSDLTFTLSPLPLVYVRRACWRGGGRARVPCGFNSSKICLLRLLFVRFAWWLFCIFVCVEAVEKMNFAGRFQCGVQFYFRMCFIWCVITCPLRVRKQCSLAIVQISSNVRF